MTSSLWFQIVVLLLSAGAIYLACEFFVNGIEWVGRLSGVSQTAVGTVLAAFGTALPESVVTLIAVVTGKDEASRNIGVGAALGGPLVLATVAYAVVGVALMLRVPGCAVRRIDFDHRRLANDQGWFLLIFVFKIGLGFVAFAIKPWLGIAFLAAYAVYCRAEMRREGAVSEEALEPLRMQAHAAVPAMTMAAVQTLLALAVIFLASHFFVGTLNVIGPALGLAPAVVALLLAPVATELPEVMNAIIWVRQGKHALALANISGSMMIQATIPTALGLFFTPWRFTPVLTLAGVITALSILGLLLLLRADRLTPRRMALFGMFYVAFAIVVLGMGRLGQLG